MEEQNTVPYKVYESVRDRSERQAAAMFRLMAIVFIFLIGTNAGWIIYELMK